MTPEWVRRIILKVNENLPKGFFGKLEVNCVNGHVGNVVVSESHKEENSK